MNCQACNIRPIEWYKNTLESIPENKLPNVAFSCLHLFRIPLNLEWIEAQFKSPVHGSWGRLAAASKPTWDKLEQCAQRGQPYSFVAIDTLIRLIPHQGELILNNLSPKPNLVSPSTIDRMTQVLREYREKDKANEYFIFSY